MKAEDRYNHFVRWSEDDQLYIGCCPDLYGGGVCHGPNDELVYAELCSIMRDEVAHRQSLGQTLPTPSVRITRDVELVAACSQPVTVSPSHPGVSSGRQLPQPQ